MTKDTSAQFGTETSNVPHSFLFLDKVIEFDPQMSDEEKLRLLTNPELLDGNASELDTALFNALFPPDLEIKPYRKEQITPKPDSELTQDERQIRNGILKMYGYVRRGEKGESGFNISPEDVPVLDVFFTDNTNTLTYVLNILPSTDRIHNLGQTQSDLRPEHERDEIDPRLNISREDHSKQYAQMVAMTNLTLAIKNPELYLECVTRDLERYKKIAKIKDPKSDFNFSLSKNDRFRNAIFDQVNSVYKFQSEVGYQNKKPLIDALVAAYEYTQYQIIYAYMHDSQTVALGDTVMKAKAKFADQKGMNFSEDDELKHKIDYFLESRSGFGLSNIVEKFDLDKDLLATMIWSLSGEGDPTLPGEIMKAKRKYSPEVLALYPHLRVLNRQPVYDHDQGSGTITNAQALLSAKFPRGLQRRRDMIGDIDPVGSIEERLRLFMFTLASGISKSELATALTELGIDPERMFIYIEEIEVGPRIALMKVDLKVSEDGVVKRTQAEILPVATRVGDLKASVTLFNILSMMDYQSKARTTTEEIIRDLLTSGFYGEEDAGKTELDPQVFRHAQDNTAKLYLYENAPLILWLIENGMDLSGVISMEQLEKITYNGALYNMLVQKWNNPYVIDTKPGSYVLTDKKNDKGQPIVNFWDKVASKRISAPDEDHPNSITNRLERAKAVYEKGHWYKVIDLNDQTIRQQFLEIISGEYPTRASCIRGLRHWLQPLVTDNKHIYPVLLDAVMQQEMSIIKVGSDDAPTYGIRFSPRE